MKDKATRKFPGIDGYEVQMVSKQEILDTIDKNIKDKDVALEIVKRCEALCVEYLQNGEWATVPFMTGFKFNNTFYKYFLDLVNAGDEKAEELLKMPLNDYIAFKVKFRMLEEDKRKFETKSSYAAAKFANKYPAYFKEIERLYGRSFAILHLYCLTNAQICTPWFIENSGYYDVVE